jgi:heterodisulfide reductase subunit B
LKPESALEGFDDADNPKTFNQLISATGAFPVDYETFNLGHGGKSFPISKEIASSLVQKRLDNIIDKGIDCIVL